MGSLAKPFHSVSFGDEEVYCVSFSPYEWSKNYLAIGTKNKVAIANVLLKNDELDFSIIREFHHLCPVITVAWSPIASTDSVPKVCKFATAGTDGKIRIYSSDLSNSENVLELVGHGDNVNSIAFQPDVEEKYLVSTSDDFTCKIWSTETGNLLKTIPLESPGMTVKFNMSEPSKFFILEKSGLVSIVSTYNFTPVTSLSHCYGCRDPSLNADWSSSDPTHIAVASGGRIQHWNLNCMSFPEETVAVAGETVQKIQFHPTLDNILGVLGSPGPVITVLRATGPALITEPLTAASDLSWHYHLPLLAVANDRSVRFWKLQIK